jgi:hypothetical protein
VSTWAIILRSYGHERNIVVTTEKNVVMQQFSAVDVWVCIQAWAVAVLILWNVQEVFLINDTHIYWYCDIIHPSRVQYCQRSLKKYGLWHIHQILAELIQTGGKTIIFMSITLLILCQWINVNLKHIPALQPARSQYTSYARSYTKQHLCRASWRWASNARNM